MYRSTKDHKKTVSYQNSVCKQIRADKTKQESPIHALWLFKEEYGDGALIRLSYLSYPGPDSGDTWISGAYPRNTEHEAGIYPGWHASSSHSTIHTFTLRGNLTLPIHLLVYFGKQQETREPRQTHTQLMNQLQ